MINQMAMMALKEIPRISKGLKTGDTSAKLDMKVIIATLKKNNPIKQGMAMAMASTSSLLKAVDGKEISEDMQKTLKKSAIKDMVCGFKCEADFENENKIKTLEELLK